MNSFARISYSETKLKKFTVLTAVSGSEGVTRSFNATHEVVAHVTFTDGSSGIVKIEVP
jgi:hypothetical protein